MSIFSKNVCPGCGATNSGMTDHCLLCQAPLFAQAPVQPDTLVQAQPLLKEAAWQLVVIQGPALGKTYPLGEKLTLGRDFTSDIQFYDGQVSRKHAVIDHLDDTYVITDQGSTNGTYVNGQRISQPTLLAHGTVVTIGFTHFRVQAYG